MTTTFTTRETRTALRGNVQYAYEAPVDEGMAQWLDVSRVGAALQLGRYLRPGREVTLRFQGASELRSVRARIVWCRPALEVANAFFAGIQVYREDPQLALDFAVLGHTARAAVNKSAVKKVEPAVWPGFSTPQRDEKKTTALHGTSPGQ